jgi:hypothetical protein
MLGQGARDLNSLKLTYMSTLSYTRGERLERSGIPGSPRKIVEEIEMFVAMKG